MYKVVSEGRLVAICEEPRYVMKKPATGAWIEADAEHAEALAVKGELFGFNGHEVEGRPGAILLKADTAEWVVDHYAQKEAIAALEDALCEMDSGVNNV